MPKRKTDTSIILPEGLEKLNEAQFQRTVVEIAAFLGYSVSYHTHFSMGSKSGFPDLALFDPNDGGAVFLEVKVGRNMPTDKQRMWLYDLRCAGFHAYVAHPTHIDLITDVLRGEYLPPQVGTGQVHPDLEPVCYPPDFAKEAL